MPETVYGNKGQILFILAEVVQRVSKLDTICYQEIYVFWKGKSTHLNIFQVDQFEKSTEKELIQGLIGSIIGWPPFWSILLHSQMNTDFC